MLPILSIHCGILHYECITTIRLPYVGGQDYKWTWLQLWCCALTCSDQLSINLTRRRYTEEHRLYYRDRWRVRKRDGVKLRCQRIRARIGDTEQKCEIEKRSWMNRELSIDNMAEVFYLIINWSFRCKASTYIYGGTEITECIKDKQIFTNL